MTHSDENFVNVTIKDQIVHNSSVYGQNTNSDYVLRSISPYNYFCPECDYTCRVKSISRILELTFSDENAEYHPINIKCVQNSIFYNLYDNTYFILRSFIQYNFACTNCEYTCKVESTLRSHALNHSDEKIVNKSKLYTQLPKLMEWDFIELTVMRYFEEQTFKLTDRVFIDLNILSNFFSEIFKFIDYNFIDVSIDRKLFVQSNMLKEYDITDQDIINQPLKLTYKLTECVSNDIITKKQMFTQACNFCRMWIYLCNSVEPAG